MINQKGIFVQTTIAREDLEKILETKILGDGSYTLAYHPKQFKNIPLNFCSYVCEGYQEVYGNRQGILFEPTEPLVYACPVDTFELMRGGNWLPGHEQFIFSSIEEMLARYPTSEDFKIDFQEYFRALKPRQVYPLSLNGFTDNKALFEFENDYCLEKNWNPGCNEVTFPKPMKVKTCRIFQNPEELRRFINP